MKGVVKVVLFGLLAAALALGVRWIYLEAADVYDSGSTTWYEDAMLEAREMFMGKPEAVQDLTALLIDEPAESLIRKAGGGFTLLRNKTECPISEEIGAALLAAAEDYPNGGKLLNIEITDDAVIYYTYYGNGGCAGFLYEKELGETSYFDYVELVENWKLFYHIPA